MSKWLKAGPEKGIAEPTITIPVTPKQRNEKKYYISMGYASMNGATWRPAMVGIMEGFNQSETAQNVIYLKGAMQYAERMPTIPGSIWQVMDEMFEAMHKAADRAIQNPLQDIPEVQPQVPLDTEQNVTQISDERAFQIVDRLKTDNLAYAESMQAMGFHLMEAVFTIACAEVPEEGE